MKACKLNSLLTTHFFICEEPSSSLSSSNFCNKSQAMSAALLRYDRSAKLFSSSHVHASLEFSSLLRTHAPSAIRVCWQVPNSHSPKSKLYDTGHVNWETIVDKGINVCCQFMPSPILTLSANKAKAVSKPLAFKNTCNKVAVSRLPPLPYIRPDPVVSCKRFNLCIASSTDVAVDILIGVSAIHTMTGNDCVLIRICCSRSQFRHNAKRIKAFCRTVSDRTDNPIWLPNNAPNETVPKHPDTSANK
uniref:Uncharacterized protein n=1 Tax=Glossina palpalis gambiensis TaxID=67801 RepID=A0A1B0B1N5_9MUSC